MKIPEPEHYLRVAWMVALNLSKDPETKVGAVLVTPDGRQSSIGYNGLPSGLHEPESRWERPEKYEWVIHAELNAVINSPFDTRGCTIYITHQPCHRCLGLMRNAGISEIYYSISFRGTEMETSKCAETAKLFRKVSKYSIDGEFLEGLKALY